MYTRLGCRPLRFPIYLIVKALLSLLGSDLLIRRHKKVCPKPKLACRSGDFELLNTD